MGDAPVFSVIGLGKLGTPTAACIASGGFKVVGVDMDKAVVDAINDGRAPIEEIGLAELIEANRDRLSATTDCASAVMESDVSIVLVPTPSTASGEFDTSIAVAVAREIGAALARKNAYHVVSLTSTVLPGATTRDFIAALEQASGLRAGPDFGVCYSPEFIALGSVIRDFFNPDFVLIGELDERSGAAMATMYAGVCHNSPPVKRIPIIDAELAKIAINTFVTTKIVFANMLGEICEKLPSADVDMVTDAVGMDSRIGKKYLKAGLGYGGPCFPRDNIALAWLARDLDVSAAVPEATDRANRSAPKRFADIIAGHTPVGGNIAVLGLSYKPGSWVVEESQGVEVAALLAGSGFNVSAYDPLAIDSAQEALGQTVRFSESMSECVRGADTVFIANPDPAFDSIGEILSSNSESRITVVDAWRNVDVALEGTHVKYVALGRSFLDHEYIESSQSTS